MPQVHNIYNNMNKDDIAQAMLSAIQDLQPSFRERAPLAKEIRRVPDESIEDLKNVGFFLALQPKRYGGYELDPQDFFRMQMAIAEGCMSTAWASGIVAVHAFQLALMDERAQEEFWKDDIHTRASSAYAPLGKVEKVEGGFNFSGRWGWSSGSDHCSWVLLGGIVPEEGYRTFLIPKSDYIIEDTWNSMGLQGTGSNDIVVDNVFVPDYRTHKQMDGFNLTNPGKDINPADLYQLPWAQIFIRVVSTPAIGACKEALNLYKDSVKGKISIDPSKQATDPATLERISAAETGIDEMETLLFRNFDQLMADVKAGRATPIEDRAKFRYQASKVIDKSMDVIDPLFSMAGGRSVFTGAEIQQRFLDVHTARAHVANNPAGFARNLGGLHLGLENADFFI
jgi:3-hydroxy-9,10-secoandrosta-1,3,5(10)-triene-9,17-dione monooxygenase